MEISPIQPFPLPFFLFSTYSPPPNYVHWTETPESHLFSADLPGLTEEEIRVEIEDSRYLIIRTESGDGGPVRRFLRKFRLPEMVDLDGISAGYEDGVLTVTVPRSYSRRRFRIDPWVGGMIFLLLLLEFVVGGVWLR